MVDLTAAAAAATRRAALGEQVLIDQVAEQATAEQKRADPKGDPHVTICWQQDAAANINGRTFEGRAGELQLVPGGVAQVVVDSGAAVLREPLTLPAWQRPEVARELRSVARELQRAADVLDPPTRRQPAKRAKRREG